MQLFLSFLFILFFTRAGSHDICVRNAPGVKFDAIFSGKIIEFFGETSGLIEVQRVYSGDQRYQNNFVVVEGFRNCAKIHQNWIHYKIGVLRLFFAEKIHDGVFQLKSTSVPIALSEFRRDQKFGKRHLASNELSGQF